MIALHNTRRDANNNPVAGSISSWHNLAIAIRIGYFDLLAAGRVISDPNIAGRVQHLSEEIGSEADAMDRFVADCWGYRPPIDRGPAGTCQTIMKRLQARFGDRAVLMEAENYHRTVLTQIQRLIRSVDSRFQPQLARSRANVEAVIRGLEALNANNEHPARSVAS
jgi:hypothetical protein